MYVIAGEVNILPNRSSDSMTFEVVKTPCMVGVTTNETGDMISPGFNKNGMFVIHCFPEFVDVFQDGAEQKKKRKTLSEEEKIKTRDKLTVNVTAFETQFLCMQQQKIRVSFSLNGKQIPQFDMVFSARKLYFTHTPDKVKVKPPMALPYNPQAQLIY